MDATALLQPNGLALMLEHLDKARSGASPLRERFMSATATSLRSPPHPLQMCRSNLSTTSLHLGSRLARSWSSHTRALVMRFLIMLSVPEGWWSGGCGVPALHLKRGERGRVPASRRAPRLFEKRPTRSQAAREKKNCFFWPRSARISATNILADLVEASSRN